MTIQTLEYIHQLLREDVVKKFDCHERNRKALHKIEDARNAAIADGRDDELDETYERTKEDYIFSRGLLNDAQNALDDFERQDF